MNARLRRILVALLVATNLFVPFEAWAESYTGNHRLRDKEGLWYVEISAQSFLKMMKRIGEYDPLRATMESIRDGFAELEINQPDAPSLGFHWHEEDSKSMCRLYNVTWNDDKTERELDMKFHYATIERKDKSCKGNGLHLRQLVSSVNMVEQLNDYTIWGVMLTQGEPDWMYSPIFANVDEVSVSIGMLPISEKILASEAGIPTNIWMEWIDDKGLENSLEEYFTDWKGLEAYGYTPTIEMSKWQKWLTVVPPGISQYPKVGAWQEAKGYADTPPVSITKYQQWLQPEAATIANTISVVGWHSVEPWVEEPVEVRSGQQHEAVVAAKISQQEYGTPAYGMVIATMCPPGFWRGLVNCILPEFEEDASRTLAGEGLKFFRVPFLKE